MAETMVAVRKARPGQGFDLEDVPIPEIRPDEVLVAVEAASVCGTDLSIWKWKGWSSQRIHPPLTVGHEFAGTVVEVGREVSDVSVGDYVSAESHVTCGVCKPCRTGQAHTCASTSILGVDRDGVFAEYAAIPEKVVWKNNRDKLPPEIATIQEPFGSAVFATMEYDLIGSAVAVLGCGPIGLFSVGIARASAAASILATDVNDDRLSMAKTMGADKVFNPSRQSEETATWLREVTGGDGPDFVFEVSGAVTALDSALKGVRSGGRVTLVGIPSSSVEIDVASDLIFKNIKLHAVNGRRIFETWYKTQWLLESGAVDVRPLITHELDMEEIDRAIDLLASGDACKIILRPRSAQRGAGTGADISQESEMNVPDQNNRNAIDNPKQTQTSRSGPV